MAVLSVLWFLAEKRCETLAQPPPPGPVAKVPVAAGDHMIEQQDGDGS